MKTPDGITETPETGGTPAPRNETAGARPASEPWRSLEQKAGDARAMSFVEREFQPGASELPDGVTRRQIMQLVGASLSMAGLAACRKPVERIVPYVMAPVEITPGIARHYATALPFGHDAIGLLVESHEGRPTKVEGNPHHPSSRGATSAWAQASLLDLYDPDRSQHPLHQGKAATWDELVAWWRESEPQHLADQGARLAVVLRAFASPTLARLAAELRNRFPQARLVVHEPISDENVIAGMTAASGTPSLPRYHLDRARVIVALDCDLLLTETGALRHAADFAAGRRLQGEDGSMNRLYAVEGVHSLTGANAEHRLRVRTSQIPGFVAMLAERLGVAVGLAGAARPGGLDEHAVAAMVADLESSRGASLLAAGRRQPAAVHAAVQAINQSLGNVGTTVETAELRDAALPDRRGWVDLAAALGAGAVDTLFLLGANPVYDAPGDVAMAEALGKAATVVHLGPHVDETAALATWHVPESHYLESWGDVRALDGTASIVQPLVAPLFASKSALEVLALLSGVDAPPPPAAAPAAGAAPAASSPPPAAPAPAAPAPAAAAAATPPAAAPIEGAYQWVRDTWRGVLGNGDFDRRWDDALRAGSIEETARHPGFGTLGSAGSAVGEPAPAGGGVELVLTESPSLFDGRYANNAWMQELPHPITKVTWENAALMSPATAAAHRLANESRVRVAVGERSLDLPVWIVPGLADDTVMVELGYGRTAAGRVANGAGGNAYTLAATGQPHLRTGVELTSLGGRHEIAQTQDHGSMEGRPIVRQASLEAFRADPEFAHEAVELPVERSMFPDRVYDQGHQWGMTIDLTSCIGCNACVVACQSENNIPVVGKQQVRNGREMHWLRIDRYFVGDDAAPSTVFHPIPCMQCENAPCEQVCPVAATVHDREGLNVMVYNRCIGTRYCSNNCPYKVRRFNFFNYTKYTPEILKLHNNPDVTVRSRGVMEKCTYCTQRISGARIRAKLEGREMRDGDIHTACQQACPTQAIEFGDIRDPESRVAKAKEGPRNYTLLEELFTKPRTSYLAKVRNPNAELGMAIDGAEPEPPAEHGSEAGR